MALNMHFESLQTVTLFGARSSKTGEPLRLWDGETEIIFSCSTKVSNSSTQKCAAHWSTKKQKGWSKTALQDLACTAEDSHRAIGTVFVIAAKTGAHLALSFPTAIPQSQGFWQHKGLEKHSTISAASSILTCNGLATQKGLTSWLYCTCQSEMQENPVPLPSWWPHHTNNPTRQLGGTPSMNITHHHFTTNSSTLTMLSDHTRNAHKPWTQEPVNSNLPAPSWRARCFSNRLDRRSTLPVLCHAVLLLHCGSGSRTIELVHFNGHLFWLHDHNHAGDGTLCRKPFEGRSHAYSAG